jgi:hypothetical protein
MGWMQVGVRTGMEWPIADIWVAYAGAKFLLRSPKVRIHAPDILCEFTGPDHQEAHRAILEFMSVLAWLKGRQIEQTTIGWTQSTNIPMMIGPAPHIQNICEEFELALFPDMSNPKAGLGLALYREALCNNSPPFKYLGFWKLASLMFGDGQPAQKQYLASILPSLNNSAAATRVQELMKGGKSALELVTDHLYISRRCAIAHATSGPVINPDDPVALGEINSELPVVHEIAKHIIQFELGVQSEDRLYAEKNMERPQPSNKAISYYLDNQVFSWRDMPVKEKI